MAAPVRSQAERFGSRRAILLDRDGTLIDDPGYLSQADAVVWKHGAIEALARLQDAGFLLILVTNQSGIGRGFFSVDDMERVHARLRRDLAAAGVTLNGIYFCPHGPDKGCDCRKPGTGMVLQAARDHGLDLGQCWMVGDKCSDMEAGRRSNMHTVLVHNPGPCAPEPDLNAADLRQAAVKILAWG